MDTTKIIKGVVGGGRYTVTSPIVKEDYGLYLKIEGLELPSTYEVDFSNSEHNGTSVTMIGNADGVLIPRQFITTGKDVFAFLYHVGADFGRTVFKFRIPNKLRPDRTDEEPTPEEQSTIDQCISALNEAVAQTAQDKADADASAQNASADAERAEEARTDAQNYATQAEQATDDAQTYANNASASAMASANSASASAQIKADVEDLVDDAQGYANASAQSASASANSASQASASATSASQSATSAQGYASQAQTSANTASAKAQDASGYAQTASQKATEATQSASQASGYASQAESAKTASQTAQGLAESARDSAQGYASDAQGYANDAQASAESISASASQIAQNTADIASLEEDRYKPYVVDTASGAIASFSDGADDLPLKSLVVDINPVQDLHGQDSPYPAGGGKNKFQTTAMSNTVNGTTFTVNADGSIRISGTPTVNINGNYVFGEVTLQAGSYKLNGNAYQNDAVRLTCYNVTTSSYIASFYNNQDVSFTLTKTSTLRLFPFVGTAYDGNAFTFYPMIRLASVTDATYAPYENICPISGWTKVGVEQRGKNLLDASTEENGYISSAGVVTADGASMHSALIKVIPGATYTFSGTASFIGSGNKRIHAYSKDGEWLSQITYATVSANTTFSIQAQIPSGVEYVKISCYKTDINKQFELGSTATPYEPYTGRSITIQLGQTVYGGKLDVLSGVLTIDRAMVDIGAQSWVYTAVQRWFYNYRLGVKSNTRNAISSMYAYKSTPDIVSDLTLDNVFTVNNTSVCIRNLAYADATEFKAAMSGVQLCYELAEPIEIQLSANQINSLYGVNNLWADSGDTEVVYRADTKLFIERLTAPDSADMIADSNITSGQYFMVGNTLYKATANIANGSAIVVGTNCIRKSLSEALNEINA